MVAERKGEHALRDAQECIVGAMDGAIEWARGCLTHQHTMQRTLYVCNVQPQVHQQQGVLKGGNDGKAASRSYFGPCTLTCAIFQRCDAVPFMYSLFTFTGHSNSLYSQVKALFFAMRLEVKLNRNKFC